MRQRHQIDAVPIAPAGVPKGSPGLRRLKDVARQLADWARAIRVMRDVDVLIMTGTGMLHDMQASMFGMPFQMFKWTVAARLCGRQVAFVSVGADGLSAPLRVQFLTWSLRLANYRSFRDRVSRDRISRIAGTPADDPLYPDLAFSLPESLTGKRPTRDRSAPIWVAVGIYAVESGRESVAKYTDTIGRFVLWLLENDYRARIVIGDSVYDQRARSELREWLSERGALDRVVDEPASSFEMLFDQLAEVDLVVATRFHNVLCGLLLEKPVVSVSHKDKNVQLMAAMGLSEYCLPLDGMELEALVARFRKLEQEGESLRRQIRARNASFRQELESQYTRLFGDRS